MHQFDLEKRTTEFGKRIIRMCQVIPKNTINFPMIDQIVRSAGSIGANYREANDPLGKKDFLYRIRIARKETKETIHWLEMIEEANKNLKPRMASIYNEAVEIRNILSSIINKYSNKE
jgi:four helix bundle protein